MSLKYVHLAFITLAGVISAGFGIWALAHGTTTNVVMGVVSMAGAAALAVYGRAFARKTRTLIVVAAVLLPERALAACPICFGQSDSPLVSGVTVGVALLLGITGSLLAAFGAFFIQLRRRMRQHAGDLTVERRADQEDSRYLKELRADSFWRTS
ncbi:MAG: hypothetical protein HYS05_05015 [Acidobacteria bacterium]|nr:hypothetical protein [Acidobacteriota bacterium]